MALDAITSTERQEMLASLEVKATAAEVWEAVRSLRIDSEAVRNARTQWLRTEFESIRFKKVKLSTISPCVSAALSPSSALSGR
jgi:hypothetical protein